MACFLSAVMLSHVDAESVTHVRRQPFQGLSFDALFKMRENSLNAQTQFLSWREGRPGALLPDADVRPPQFPIFLHLEVQHSEMGRVLRTNHMEDFKFGAQ